jgi:hypothetical protein
MVAASLAIARFTPSAAQQGQGIPLEGWVLDLLTDEASPDLQYVFGPQQGHGTGDCPPPNPAPPPNPDSPSGCVVRFTIRPSAIEVDLKVFNLPESGWVVALACRDSTHCPAVATATKAPNPTPPEPVLYSARITLTSSNIDGITQICGVANLIIPAVKSYPLACRNLAGSLRAVAGAFKATPSREGLILEGWALDLLTDGPGVLSFYNGSEPGSPSVLVTAGQSDTRSTPPWPGFSDLHGFKALLPYAAAPGPRSLCVRIPATSTTAERSVSCFAREQQPAAFGPEGPVTQGNPIHISLRSVGAGTNIQLNFQSDGGYFIMPWTDAAIWQATADANGSAELNIDSSFLPPADYTIAFHCTPECPYGNLKASGLVGGPAWSGSIGLGSIFTVRPASTSTLTVASPSPNTVRIVGAGFLPNQPLRLMVIPNAKVFDGPPTEAASVDYPVTDTQGLFSVDMPVGGFPLDGNRTQIVAFSEDGHPIASTFYVK